jgi:hypothetical protein
MRAFSIFGGMDNKAPNTVDPNAPRLVIEGLVIFGGGDVKLKKTFRQRLVEFADGLRSFFDAQSSASKTS